MAKYILLDDNQPVAKGGYVLLEDSPQKPAVESIGQTLKRNIEAVPRQVGLTARHALEGGGETLDFLATPIRELQNAIMPSNMQARTGMGAEVADYFGLPKPANSTERVVGEVSKLVTGGGGLAAAADKAAKLAKVGGTGQKIAQALAARPDLQLASAAGSGFLGGSVKEAGGGEGSQLAASVIGGLVAPSVVGLGKSVANAGKSAVNAIKSLSSPVSPNVNIDIQIQNALKGSGVDFGKLSDMAKNNLRADIGKALKTDGNLSPDAVRRLAEYRAVGATPTAATLSLNPVDVTQQKNLAKVGANSKDQAAQILANVENQNNAQLIGELNALGAATGKTPLAGGQQLSDALGNYDSAWRGAIKQYYDAARGAGGRSAMLDPSVFTNQANDLLEQNLLQAKLPADVRNLLNKTALGEIPLTVDVAEQLKTRIGDLQRSSNDRAEQYALGLVRQSLDNTPLLQGQEIGEDAIKAFNRARRVNRTYMGIVEKNPALKAVREGYEPDKFIQDFIVGQGGKAAASKTQNLANLLKKDPEVFQSAKDQIALYLKDKALNQATDEVGKFSSTAYNKALKGIGDAKLSAFFTPEELTKLKSIGKVASYEQFQPIGAAVNNSNSGALMLGSFGNALRNVGESALLSKIPFAESFVQAPLQNIAIGMQSGKALDLARALQQQQAPLTFQQRMQNASPMLLPSILGYGMQQQ